MYNKKYYTDKQIFNYKKSNKMTKNKQVIFKKIHNKEIYNWINNFELYN